MCPACDYVRHVPSRNRAAADRLSVGLAAEVKNEEHRTRWGSVMVASESIAYSFIARNGIE